MERRFELRKEALLEECEVNRWVFDDAIGRLERYVHPFADRLARRGQRQHARTFVSGLVSDVDRKDTESIGYRHDQDRKDLQRRIIHLPCRSSESPIRNSQQTFQSTHRFCGRALFLGRFGGPWCPD